MNKYLFLNIICLIIILSSCSNNSSRTSMEKGTNEYATYFKITENEKDTTIEVKEKLYDNSDDFNSYFLTSNFDFFNKRGISQNVIKIPLKRVICMSTGHVAYLNTLGEIGSIIAVSGSKYINNEQIIDLIKQNKIADVGYESSLNYELILSLKPDMIFTYGVSGENNSYIDKLRQLGIPVLVLGDFNENHPLGKLEYLKLFGALFSKQHIADSIFNAKKTSYLEIKDKLSKIEKKPNVLLNAPWKETWYLPGADSYMTKLINDAGANVLGAKPNTSISGSSNIEEVYRLSLSADYWLNPNSYNTIKSLKQALPLFNNIKVVKEGNIYNNIKKITSSGGSDFWENGVIEPEIILMDLAKIFHPDMFVDHEFRYYIKLSN